ncbi:MAG TPA: BlaI/MecI/CopY family transcriptional regulator [Fimbriimonas sp.]|nr:BlaI/MecI/CopY family transcriptional regulator [Fimbriimonas sp.]
MIKNGLSRREREILDALYRLGKASAAEIHEAIPDPPTYTAVRTHLANLEEKGQVRFESDGTRYIYEPTVPRQEMAKSVIDDVLKTFFENKVELVVSTLINRQESQISQEELDRLAELIEQARKEGQ